VGCDQFLGKNFGLCTKEIEKYWFIGFERKNKNKVFYLTWKKIESLKWWKMEKYCYIKLLLVNNIN